MGLLGVEKEEKGQTFGDRVFDNVTSAFTPANAQEKEFGDVS